MSRDGRRTIPSPFGVCPRSFSRVDVLGRQETSGGQLPADEDMDASLTRRVLGQRGPRVWVVALFVAAAVLFVTHWLPCAREYFAVPQPVQSGQMRPQYDLWQYYAAGTNWRLGDDPYAPSPERPGTIPIPRSTLTSGYIYPPFALPALALLSRLSYDRARVVWLCLSLAGLMCPLVLGVSMAHGRRWETAAVGALLLTAADPVLFHIRQGQIDMIVAGLAVSAFLLYGRLRCWPSAALFAVAIALKLTPVVLVFALVAYHRDWRLLAKSALMGLTLLAVSLVVVSPALYIEYVTSVLPAASEGNPFFHNQSLLRGWSHLGSWAKFACLGGYALVVAAAGVAGRAARTATASPGRLRLTPDGTQLLMLSVAGVLLFSPLSWRMAFVWAIVPLAIVIVGVPWCGGRRDHALLILGAVLICLPVWDAPILDSLETIGTLLAGAGALSALLRPRRRDGRVAQRRLSTQSA